MAEPFLEVIDAEEARRRFRGAVNPAPLGTEEVALDRALGRILAEDLTAPTDVPGFDRSNVDGFAVRATDTFGAEEDAPRRLLLTGEELTPGMTPQMEVAPGSASRLATGSMVPRGADAVVMLEHADVDGEALLVRRPVTPGGRISFSASDIARGEVVVRRGTRLGARETGTIAAVGVARVTVRRRPRVAVISTGDEIIAPGEELAAGLIYDSNRRILTDTLRELGCDPIDAGIVSDDPAALRARVEEALDADVVLLSGGTSKGEGDHGPAVIRELGEVICHGVAIKPGKPICLGVVRDKPVIVLPGFPTSAVFTFHEFVAPLLLELAGAPPRRTGVVQARMPLRIDSERGRAEFVLVSLLVGDAGFMAYPMGKGSGSVTTFSRADGFIRLDRQQEFVDVDESVDVQLLGPHVEPADLVVVGSHCLGLDLLLGLLRERGFTAKTLVVGSEGGLLAARRAECDVATMHLCDESGVYTTPFLGAHLEVLGGYGRMQGILHRPGDERPDPKTARMINRNRGSGTRILVDELLGDARPPGYHLEARSHNAVAVAIAQGRADWGVGIETVARLYGLEFERLREERYDFVVPVSRRERPAIAALREILAGAEARDALRGRGFLP